MSTTFFAHKGEVVMLSINAGTTNTMFLPPQVARDMAQNLIKAAEAAEQQMDNAV